MRIQGFEFNARTIVLGLAVCYAAGALIVMAVLIHSTVWPAVSHAL